MGYFLFLLQQFLITSSTTLAVMTAATIVMIVSAVIFYPFSNGPSRAKVTNQVVLLHLQPKYQANHRLGISLLVGLHLP